MRASFEQGKSIDEFSAPEFSLYLQDKASSGGGTVTEGGSDENATLFGDAEQPLAAYGDAQTVAPAASPRLPCLSLVEMHGGMQSQAKDAFKRLMSVAFSTEEQLADGLSDAEARAQRTAQQERLRSEVNALCALARQNLDWRDVLRYQTGLLRFVLNYCERNLPFDDDARPYADTEKALRLWRGAGDASRCPRRQQRR